LAADELAFEPFIRDQVLRRFCPGYTPGDLTVPGQPVQTHSEDENEVLPPKLIRVQAGFLPQGEEDGRLELIVTDGRHECLLIPSTAALKAFFHENADQQVSKASFLGDRRSGESTEGAAMVGEVLRLDDYRLLLESGPRPAYGARRITFMEGLADELGGDEEEEEEEEADEEGNPKEKEPKPEDPLLTELEIERVLTVRRRLVRGDDADRANTFVWESPTTQQTNPQPAEKKTDPDAMLLLHDAGCLHGKYASVVVGPKILYFFDKSGARSKRPTAVQERIVTTFDAERNHFGRKVIVDSRVPEDCEEDLGWGSPVAVAVAGKVYVFGGAPIERQEVLTVEPVSMETGALVYPGDESFPACDFSEAIVGVIGSRIVVLSGELTGGWGAARVLDTAAPPPADVAATGTNETEAQGEAEAQGVAEAAADGEEPAAEAAYVEQRKVDGVWETVMTEGELPGGCGKGERHGVCLGHEMWVVTATEAGMEVSVLNFESNYWLKVPVTGKLPPRLRHFNLVMIGRNLHVIGGRLDEAPTPAFKGDGLVYESGYDHMYVLDTDRCEWSERSCHGLIPKAPVRACVNTIEGNLWTTMPTLDGKTWWLAGVPTLPEDRPKDTAVKCTKFGAVQSIYMLPKVVYPPLDPDQAIDLSHRTWEPTPEPTKWKELEDRDYLNRTVWPTLLRGMSMLEKERPNNPVQILAQFLLEHDKGVPK